jgi:hypothetical protein
MKDKERRRKRKKEIKRNNLGTFAVNGVKKKTKWTCLPKGMIM